MGTEAGTGRALGGHWVGTVTWRLGPIYVAHSAAVSLNTRLHTHVSVRSGSLVSLPVALALMVLSTHAGHGPRLASSTGAKHSAAVGN